MRPVLCASLVCVAVMSSGYVWAETVPVFRPVSEDHALILPTGGAPRVQKPVVPVTPQTASSTTEAVQESVDATGMRPLPRARSGEVIDSEGGGAIPALSLEITTQNGISYVSGGVSDEEVDQLRAQAEIFNLHLQVTGKHGEYVSNVHVVLKNKVDETLAHIEDAGPYVYFQVPAGDYVVEVGGNGHPQKIRLKAPEKGAQKAHIKV